MTANAMIEQRGGKVDRWGNSSQRQRWLVAAILDIESRLNRIAGHRHLPRLREAITRELTLDQQTLMREAA